MSPVDFTLEVEPLDEVIILGSQLFLRNSFGIDLCVLAEIGHRMVPRRFTVYPVRVSFINSDTASFLLVGDPGLLDQALNQVLNRSVFGNKYIKLVLN